MFKKQISKEYKGMKCVGRLCVHEHMGGWGEEREQKRARSHRVCSYAPCQLLWLYSKYYGAIGEF